MQTSDMQKISHPAPLHFHYLINEKGEKKGEGGKYKFYFSLL